MAKPESPYALDRLQAEASALIATTGLVPSDLVQIAEPKGKASADLTFCTYATAKATGTDAKDLAQRLANAIVLPPDALIDRVEVVGAYLNFYRHPTRFAVAVLADVFERENAYGHSYSVGQGKNVIVDFPAANLSRRPGIDMLRYAAMGQSLSLLLTALGYNVRTSIVYEETSDVVGKMLAALDLAKQELWHHPNPVRSLEDIYYRFFERSRWDGQTEPVEAAAQWRAKWEAGDPRARETWRRIVALHRWEFESLFKRLGVRFELTREELFSQEIAEEVVAEALQKGVAHAEEGKAVAVRFGEDAKGLSSCLLRKANGASLYLTRTLARMIYRHRTYPGERCIYVIPAEQKLVFEQAFAIMRRLGYAEAAENAICIPTEPIVEMRSAVAVCYVQDTDGSYRWQSGVVQPHPPQLEARHRWTHKQINYLGIRAIKYASLCVGAEHAVRAVIERGAWCPVVNFNQYMQINCVENALVQCRRFVGTEPIDFAPECAGFLKGAVEQRLLKQLARMPQVVRSAGEQLRPVMVAQCTYELACASGQFHATYVRPTATFNNIRRARTNAPQVRALRYLIAAVAQGLKNGLALLGIYAAE